MKAIIVKTNNLLSNPSASSDDLISLVKELKRDIEFGLALKVLSRLEEKDYFPPDILRQEGADPQKRKDTLWVQQQKALCTYRNEDAYVAIRLRDALAILEKIGLGEGCDPETLGLTGAVYKRFWEYRGRIEDLFTALAFYRRAWESKPEEDLGYGGVNAAFILDILADRAGRAVKKADAKKIEDAERYSREAQKLRLEMKDKLPGFIEKAGGAGTKYWYPATLGEVYMGLGEYKEAGRYLAEARQRNPEAWEYQASVRQLISIVKMQGHLLPGEDDPEESWPPAWKALREFLGEYTKEAIRSYRGKVGLSLSGGGFRASIFHLGVLAALAEADVLRCVEVISTVSGGSIVGAYYYLELQHMLENTEDKDLTNADYIALVQRVQHNFLSAVQKNLRVRALGDLCANLKMLIKSGYTRSIKLAELYQKHIFNQTPGGPPSRKSHTMPDLMIAPRGEDVKDEFSPLKANWRRRTKIPILLINTASLNSGHNFHFTARFMGEPPALVGDEVDMNARYRRVNYNDLHDDPRLSRFPLGQAVAASACVPGLFEPVELKGLYPGYDVRLVDGGVHDNQGVAGLLDEGCTLIICSDASGQMNDNIKPDTSRLGVLMRSNSIFMDRVREAQYEHLAQRVDDGSLEGLFFVHLKKDLGRDPIDWVDCQDPTLPIKRETTTSYGIDRTIQLCLSDIRTDLDSFTDVEAYALMTSGYAMALQTLKHLASQESPDERTGSWKGFTLPAEPESEQIKKWPFLALRDIMAKDGQSTDQRRKDLEKQLSVASQAFFKIWRLNPVLMTISIVMGVLLIGAGVWWLLGNWKTTYFTDGFTVQEIFFKGVLPLLALVVPGLAWLFPMRAVQNFIFNVGLVFTGWLLAGIHLLFFDKLFLRRGSLRRLMRL